MPLNKTKKNGFFLTFEGIEGCGKSTQARMLSEYLRNEGYSVLLTKEPGGTALGGKLRELVLCGNGIKIDSIAELFIYAADRFQHVREAILPALNEGKIVICDRFSDATIAYQGYARGLDMDMIRNINSIACGGAVPDITLLMDLDVRAGLDRAFSRNQLQESVKREDRFEREGLIFHEKVRQGYLELAKAQPERFKIIDASKSIEAIHKDIILNISIGNN